MMLYLDNPTNFKTKACIPWIEKNYVQLKIQIIMEAKCKDNCDDHDAMLLKLLNINDHDDIIVDLIIMPR
jgi:hypothetical protein